MAMQRLTVAGRAYGLPVTTAVRVVHYGSQEVAYAVTTLGAVGLIDAKGPRPVPPQLHDAVLSRLFPRHARRLLHRDETIS